MGEGVVAACALAWLSALTAYDVTQRRLPNALTVPGAVVVLVVAAFTERGTPALLGALALAALYLGVHLLTPAAMGAGDVKLAVGVGALTGAFGVDAWLLAAITAPLLTALWGIVVRRAGASEATGRTAGASEATGRTAGASEGTGRTAGASEATGKNAVPHGPSMCIASFAAVALVLA